MRARGIISLVIQYGRENKSEDRFALFDAIKAGIEKIEQERDSLENKVNCSEIELDLLRMQIVSLELELKEIDGGPVAETLPVAAGGSPAPI